MVKKRATAASSEQGIQDLSATGKEKTTKTTESRKYLIKQKKVIVLLQKQFNSSLW